MLHVRAPRDGDGDRDGTGGVEREDLSARWTVLANAGCVDRLGPRAALSERRPVDLGLEAPRFTSREIGGRRREGEQGDFGGRRVWWLGESVRPGRRVAEAIVDQAIVGVVSKARDDEAVLGVRDGRVVGEIEAVVGVDEEETVFDARILQTFGLEHRAPAVAIREREVIERAVKTERDRDEPDERGGLERDGAFWGTTR